MTPLDFHDLGPSHRLSALRREAAAVRRRIAWHVCLGCAWLLLAVLVCCAVRNRARAADTNLAAGTDVGTNWGIFTFNEPNTWLTNDYTYEFRNHGKLLLEIRNAEHTQWFTNITNVTIFTASEPLVSRTNGQWMIRFGKAQP